MPRACFSGTAKKGMCADPVQQLWIFVCYQMHLGMGVRLLPLVPYSAANPLLRPDCRCAHDVALQISDSEDDAELAELAEGSDDDDGGSPQARAKRPRPVRASAGGVEPAAAAAAAPAAAAVGAVVVPAAIPPAVVPPDTAKGAAEGASARMIACLQELAVL